MYDERPPAGGAAAEQRLERGSRQRRGRGAIDGGEDFAGLEREAQRRRRGRAHTAHLVTGLGLGASILGGRGGGGVGVGRDSALRAWRTATRGLARSRLDGGRVGKEEPGPLPGAAGEQPAGQSKPQSNTSNAPAPGGGCGGGAAVALGGPRGQATHGASARHSGARHA
jgi:hypothetical protein